MPKLTKKQSRDSAQKSGGTDAENELVGATAPPSVSSAASEGGATASPQSVRTEEEWAELVAALQEMRVANAELKRANAELQLKLRDEMAAAAAATAAAATLRPRNPQRSHRSTSTEGRTCQQPPLGRPPEGVRPHSIASSAPHQARESNCRVDQYFQRTQSPSLLAAAAARDPKSVRAGRALADDKPPAQRTYVGPRPSIPHLTSPDTREFLKMKIALENVVPADATERLKFKILAEHLKYEEASLVADLHRNSRSPYTDTMRMLTKMYAQPHKVAMQRIGELVDGPDVHSGDFQAFSLFALRVRSLVGMLEQLRGQGHKELECGSHVTRLLSKLPHELNVSFKRFLYPQRVDVPTLVEFAEWLEYELEVQEDTI